MVRGAFELWASLAWLIAISLDMSVHITPPLIEGRGGNSGLWNEKDVASNMSPANCNREGKERATATELLFSLAVVPSSLFPSLTVDGFSALALSVRLFVPSKVVCNGLAFTTRYTYPLSLLLPARLPY